MTQLVLLHHGQSIWNRDGHFTGWSDVVLTAEGEQAAQRAGRSDKRSGRSSPFQANSQQNHFRSCENSYCSFADRRSGYISAEFYAAIISTAHAGPTAADSVVVRV